jgi:hypothetical protein
MLVRVLGWPLAMIKDIEAAKQFDLALNDIAQLVSHATRGLMKSLFAKLSWLPTSAHDPMPDISSCFGSARKLPSSTRLLIPLRAPKWLFDKPLRRPERCHFYYAIAMHN